jgi:hypothetical protein
MFVYVIVCSETLKIYVGQHKGSDLRQYLQQKWSEARRGISTRSRLYSSMRKHPRATWSIHPLISNLTTREECDRWEKMLIVALNAQHPDVGYNICRGGEGFTGPHTEQWRKATLDRINAYWANPKNREQRRKESTERWPESQKALATWRTKNPEKMAYWKGKTRSEESKQKTSQSLMGHQNRLGQIQSLEEKAKKSASLKQFYQDHPRGPASESTKMKLKSAHRTCSCPTHVRARQKQDSFLHK